MTLICSCCRQPKLSTDFRKVAKPVGLGNRGLQKVCKQCISKKSADTIAKKKEYITNARRFNT